MKTKLVLWALDTDDKKVLLAFQLRVEDNIVDIWAFREDEATPEVHRRLLYEWREGKEMAFPESGYEHFEVELTASESLLPPGVKVEKDDLITRAQTEWHFVVLSSKLNQSYKEELADLEDKVGQIEAFDQGLWEELKGFWDKVQEQVRERNLSRDHADLLRDKTNNLFNILKGFRSKLDEEFKKQAQVIYEKFEGILTGVENRLKDKPNLALIFNELKDIQKDFRSAKLTRDLRAKMWDRIDGTFKIVKEKRFGNASASGNSPLERIERRYTGLLKALKRMEQSIRKDEDDLNYQQQKIDNSGTGQLEAQLREAKVKMIMERIRSKKEKLSDMNGTKVQLEKQIEKEKAKEAKRQAEKTAKEEASKKEEKALEKEEPKTTAEPAQKKEPEVKAKPVKKKAPKKAAPKKKKAKTEEKAEEVVEQPAPKPLAEEAKPEAETPSVEEEVIAQAKEDKKTD